MTAEQLAKAASVAVVTARKWLLGESVRGLAAERCQEHAPRALAACVTSQAPEDGRWAASGVLNGREAMAGWYDTEDEAIREWKKMVLR